MSQLLLNACLYDEMKGGPRVAVVALSRNFNYFFTQLNPSPSFVQQAAREHASVTGLIADPRGLARELAPQCFLQGSYSQDTAIYTINDVDIVVLCQLWFPGSGSGDSWGRDRIFNTIAAPLLGDSRYRDKVRYGPRSMCIKVDLGIKLEILPVVYRSDNNDPSREPFVLWRPERSQWEDGYARQHQALLIAKNATALTGGHFKPAIKILKHLRSRFRTDAVSFHIECLLYRLPNQLYLGGPADYIPAVLGHIAATSADRWYATEIPTPCGDRAIFTGTEWEWASWRAFHERVTVWANAAQVANEARDPNRAIAAWQALLGDDRFPREVSP
jgi:hypothetical protein